MRGFTLTQTKVSLKFLIRFALVVAVFAEIYYSDWLPLFVTLAALILTFGPELFEKKYQIYLPEEFEIGMLLFIYLTLYLGDIQQFYQIFWWWDVLLHGFSAISIGIVGFIVMLYLQQGNKVHARPLLICLFAFSFAVAVGALWEIFEFSLDQIFDLTTQDNSLIDTMWDLIIDAIGALIGSFSGYIYLRDHKSGFAYTIREFIRLNSSLFRRFGRRVSRDYNSLRNLRRNR